MWFDLAAHPVCELTAFGFQYALGGLTDAFARRHPYLLEIVGRQMGQRARVNLIVLERLLVALQAQLAQPGRNIQSAPRKAMEFAPLTLSE